MTEEQLNRVIKKILEAQATQGKKWYDLAEKYHGSVPVNWKTIFTTLVLAAILALCGAGWNTYTDGKKNSNSVVELTKVVTQLTLFIDENKKYFEGGPRYTKEEHDLEMGPKFNSLIRKIDVLQDDVDYLKKEIQTIKKRGE